MALFKKSRHFSLAHSYFSFITRRKVSDRLIFNTVLCIVCISVVFTVLKVNSLYTQSVPTSGGTLVEGIVGTPRFVNPVLAINRADHDMVALIYSGILKLDENGNLVNDIAQSLDVGEDGKTYHIVLRKNVRFHNGQELKVRDIAYTIALIQNPDLKSPLRGNWEGVKIEEIGEYEMNIILEEAYAPFTENLLVGILPRELWDELPIEQVPFSQNNTQPIGTGPYMVTDVLRNKSGLINGYKLSAFNSSSDKPNISTLVFNFYQNEEDLKSALTKKEIASTPSLSPQFFSEVSQDTYQVIQSPLPRTFAVYFNQNKSIALRDLSVRNALAIAIDKKALVALVLNGNGIPTDSPVPPGFLTVDFTEDKEKAAEDSVSRIVKAQAVLTSGGWVKNERGIFEKVIDNNRVTLSVSLSTANTALFDQTATYLSDTWKTLGAEVTVSQFEQTDLVQTVIRPRDFEALLYGADIGRQVDLYPFWHSSQKNDPGLNIAQYTNIDVDGQLEKTRKLQSFEERKATIESIETIILKDTPAVFLFVPTFGYILDKSVTVTPFTRLSRPSERFANISAWHMKSNNVWPIFSNKTQ